MALVRLRKITLGLCSIRVLSSHMYFLFADNIAYTVICWGLKVTNFTNICIFVDKREYSTGKDRNLISLSYTI